MPGLKFTHFDDIPIYTRSRRFYVSVDGIHRLMVFKYILSKRVFSVRLMRRYWIGLAYQSRN